MIFYLSLLIFVVCSSDVRGFEIVDTCLSTKINIRNNVSMEFCGNWNCTFDYTLGKKIRMCKFLDGPQDIEDCIGAEKENCGLYNCVIRSPYLNFEDCSQMTDNETRLFEGNKAVTCPPCSKCPTPIPCLKPVCRCRVYTCPPFTLCPTYPPCPTCAPRVTCKPCQICR